MKILIAFATLLLTQSVGIAARVTVESHTDNEGYYWYTFSRGDQDRFFNLGSEGGGGISLKIEGLTSITTPSNWSFINQTGGWIRFNADNPVWILDTNTVTLGFTSILTNGITYGISLSSVVTPNTPHVMGVIGGVVYDTEHNPVSGDQEDFSFIGPAVAPQPATTSLLIVAASNNEDFQGITVSNGAARFPVYIQRCTDLTTTNWVTITFMDTSETNTKYFYNPGNWKSVFYRLRQ